MKLTRKLLSILAVLAILVIMASPVLAFLYSAPFTVSNNSTTTAYTMLPVTVSVNNTFLAANGFITTSGNDTRVETVGGLIRPHMVADNKTLTAVAAPISSQTNLRYTTGNAALASMDIITGYGGYVTVADNATMELGASFAIESDLYVNTALSGNILNKPYAYKLDTDGAGSVNSTIYAVTAGATINLLPDGVGDYTNLTPTGAVNNWDTQNDPVGAPDDFATFVENANPGVLEKDAYTLQDPTFLGLSQQINSVTGRGERSATFLEIGWGGIIRDAHYSGRDFSGVG
jgi:hypothetical protein